MNEELNTHTDSYTRLPLHIRIMKKNPDQMMGDEAKIRNILTINIGATHRCRIIENNYHNKLL